VNIIPAVGERIRQIGKIKNKRVKNKQLFIS